MARASQYRIGNLKHAVKGRRPGPAYRSKRRPATDANPDEIKATRRRIINEQ